MIEFISHYFKHYDERGSITGLVNFGNWKELNIIESESGEIRGNHYHKNTDELFIILDGLINVQVQEVREGGLVNKMQEFNVKQGDVFLIKKNINHTFEILETSRWINALSVRTDENSPDINRIKCE